MIDIVFSRNCENMSKKLGFTKLIVIDNKLIAKQDLENQIIFATDKPKKNVLSIVKAKDVRAQIMNKNIDVIYGVEGSRDFIHHRNSGLNQVLLKLANEKNKQIAFSLKDIYDPGKVGRIMQSIKLCRKYGVKTIFASFAKKAIEMRNPKDMVAILITLGMHPKEAKEAVSWKHTHLAD